MNSKIEENLLYESADERRVLKAVLDAPRVGEDGICYMVMSLSPFHEGMAFYQETSLLVMKTCCKVFSFWLDFLKERKNCLFHARMDGEAVLKGELYEVTCPTALHECFEGKEEDIFAKETVWMRKGDVSSLRQIVLKLGRPREDDGMWFCPYFVRVFPGGIYEKYKTISFASPLKAFMSGVLCLENVLKNFQESGEFLYFTDDYAEDADPDGRYVILD